MGSVGHRSRRTRQVVLRFVLLVVAYLVWGALVLAAMTVDGSPSTTVTATPGHVIRITSPGSSLYQVDPGPVRAILSGLAVALAVSTASVIWRVLRRSTKVGVAGMIAAGLVGATAVVGMLTVGIFVLPFAALLVVLALPIAPERIAPVSPPTAAPPGWYGDPAGSGSLRFWDGRAWTEELAPVDDD